MTILEAVAGELRAQFVALSGINDPRMTLSQAITQGLSPIKGITVNQRTALQLAMVYRAVTLIADDISSLPIKIVRRDDEMRTPARERPHRVLWDWPNAEQSRVDFWATALLSLLLWGNTYIARFDDRTGAAAELWVIDPSKMRAGRADDGTKVFEFAGQPFTEREIIHVPWHTQAGKVTGMSPITIAKLSMALGIAMDEFAGQVWSEGTLAAGTLETEVDLKPGQATALLRRWQAANTGMRSAGKTAVLDNKVTYKPFTLPLGDAQFLAQVELSDSRILAMYGIPQFLAGQAEKQSNWGTGVAENEQALWVHTHRPKAIRFEQAMERAILGPDFQMKFVFDALLRAAPKQQMEIFRGGRHIGRYTINDMLRLFDEAPIDGSVGDLRLIPKNMIGVGPDGEIVTFDTSKGTAGAPPQEGNRA